MMPAIPIVSLEIVGLRNGVSAFICSEQLSTIMLRLCLACAESLGKIFKLGSRHVGNRPIGQRAVGPSHDVVAFDWADRSAPAQRRRQRRQADYMLAGAVDQGGDGRKADNVDPSAR